MPQKALADICRHLLLEHYAPAAVLVNDALEAVFAFGPTGDFLPHPQGKSPSDVSAALPVGLRAAFRAAVKTCIASQAQVTVPRAGGAGFDLALYSVAQGAKPLVLVCFLGAVGRVAGRSATGAMLPSGDALSKDFAAETAALQALNADLVAVNSQLQDRVEQHRATATDLQNILHSTDVATLCLDADLRIRFFTPAARAVFRMIPSDVGRPLADLAAVAPDDELASDARAVLTTQTASERETAGLNGVWFLRRIQPYRGEGAQAEGVVITYIDITERRNITAALITAKGNAERATKAKSRFLAAASHDLRQPLQSMALLHKLLARPKRSAEGVRLAKLLDQTLNSMTAMLESMLDVNRIETGIVRPEMRPIPIAPLMQRLAEEYAPHCGLKGLRLHSVPCKAWVQTDPQLLEQILRNLLSNALKYTPRGGILMGCRRRGALLTIIVCDSGIGITEAERTTIFDPYRQGEGALSFGEHGLGLGLSIVQRLAKLLDHPITLRSTPGKGSAFMLTLPVVEPVADAPPAGRAPRPPAVVEVQTGTILVVEDEEPLRDLLAEVLRSEGHTVVSKADSQEALDWASGDVAPPDLLLTDFDLHDGANGLALASDLQDVMGGTVPTIILTGDITTATLTEIKASPFHQVMKPVLPEVLLALASELMRKARKAKKRKLGEQDPSAICIYVIDDDPMIRQTMRRLFQAEGWSVVLHPSAESFLAEARPEGLGCLLVDNILPGISGVELITQLRAEQDVFPAVILTGHGDASMAVAALKAGAFDLIEKPASAADLLTTLRLAIKQLDQDLPQTETRKAARKRFSKLTAREKQVLAHVLAGAPNKIIAADLGLNQRTVEGHRASVMRKTGVRSLPALVRLAFAADLDGVDAVAVA
jgi:two-component system CheB/CheR fusion protein